MEFSNRNIATAHERKHHGDEIITCSRCSKEVKLAKMKGHNTTHRTQKCYKNSPMKICNICGVAVKNLQRHLTTHRDERKFKCSVCGKDFKLAWDMKKHLISHVGEAKHQEEEPNFSAGKTTTNKEHLCTECGKKSLSRAGWYAHMKRHDQRKKGLMYPCDVCGLQFFDKRTVEFHKRRVHLEDLPCCCEQCGRTFVSQGYLTNHQKTSHRELKKQFPCPFKECKKTCNTSGTLRYHILTHEKKTYQCNVCSEIFHHPFRLRRHVKKYHENNPKPIFQCNFCGMQVTTGCSLKNHIRTHTGEKPFECQCECQMVFTRKNNLEKHIRKVHRGDVVFHQCEICGKKFRDKSYMDSHIKLIHLKIYNVHCEICGKGFLYESQLNKHKHIAHEGRKVNIIICPEEGCGKTYTTKEALKYHQNAAHISEKPTLICTQCEKTFTHPYAYQKHMRYHVKGPLLYSCKICQKEISTLSSFKDHMRSHTGERPFICEQCGKGFHSKKHLKAHVVVHTGERPFGCKVCLKMFSQRGTLSGHMQKCHPNLAKNI
ncbi:hypothetical protein HUJ04_003611 [Dendroctonus ponderosae]|nr:hypothetical protein HUJ04_003611 [Dendroctonus ponderosae]